MRHHPGDELLMAYATGASSEAMSLILASHLAFCGQCRKTVNALEVTGGALLGDLQPAVLEDGALDHALSKLDAQATRLARSQLKSNVPAPLRPYIGNDLGKVAWRRIAPGIAYFPLFTRGGLQARLIRAAGGSGVASHGHRGNELTLVLEGGFTDETGQYSAGDFQTTSPEIVHAPVADPDGHCINLAVTDAPLVFNGILPKLIGKLTGF